MLTYFSSMVGRSGLKPLCKYPSTDVSQIKPWIGTPSWSPFSGLGTDDRKDFVVMKSKSKVHEQKYSTFLLFSVPGVQYPCCRHLQCVIQKPRFHCHHSKPAPEASFSFHVPNLSKVKSFSWKQTSRECGKGKSCSRALHTWLGLRWVWFLLPYIPSQADGQHSEAENEIALSCSPRMIEWPLLLAQKIPSISSHIFLWILSFHWQIVDSLYAIIELHMLILLLNCRPWDR